MREKVFIATKTAATTVEGFWKDLEEIRANWAVDREFSPALSAEERTTRLEGWKHAVGATRGWSK